MPHVRLGYACISLELRKQGIFTSRSLILATLNQKGTQEAMRLALLNIEDLIRIIEYNEKRGIRFFRISSGIFPQYTNHRTDQRYDMEFARATMRIAGAIARGYGHRLTMHPAQYIQLGSPNQEIVQRSVEDLNMHAEVIRSLGYGPELGSVLIIHGGGSYGDKASALARFEKNFQEMPSWTQSLIALENDEWQYTVMDLLPICERNNIPLCIDFFHHQISNMNPNNNFDVFAPAVIERVMAIWQRRGIKPKVHWSNQKPDARKGTHSDCVNEIPRNILRVCRDYNADIMLEVKEKDECLLKMYKKHFNKTCNNGRVEWYLRDI